MKCPMLALFVVLVLNAHAQLFTFQGQVNYTSGSFADRYQLGDEVSGYIDFHTSVTWVGPHLAIYGADTSLSIDGERLFTERDRIASMSNNYAGTPVPVDGWGINIRVEPFEENYAFFAVIMNTYEDIMSEPANPPDGVPLSAFVDADGFFQAIRQAGIDEIRWEITSYSVTADRPIPEPGIMTGAAAGALLLLAFTRWQNAKRHSAVRPEQRARP